MTLQELAEHEGYELRHVSQPLTVKETFNLAITPFVFSDKYGGTTDSFKHYTTHYLYPKL